MTAPRPTFRLVLRAEPDNHDPTRTLRALLKAALRCYGMRALEVAEVPAEPEDGS